VPNFRPKYEVRFSTTAISMISAGMGVAVLPENSSQLASAVR
jgi:DNA-binding transcriptional LysR family regulator